MRKQLLCKWTVALYALFTAFATLGCNLNIPGDSQADARYLVIYISERGSVPESISVQKNTVLSAEQLPVLSADGWTFLGWYIGDRKISAGTYTVTKDVALMAKWTNLGKSAAYKVEHYKQNADDDGYTLFETENLTGTTGLQTSAVAKTYGHFTAKEFSQTTINADGTTVVKIYYDREIFKISFDANGGEGTMESLSVKYGSTVTLPESTFTKTGFIFAGWNTAADGSGAEFSTLDADIVLYAQWTPGTGISYKVEHYRQNADDDGYTLFETESMTGTTGLQTSAVAKTYGHFTAKEFSQTTIRSDGTTVVKIYYDREIFKISFDANGGEGTMESLSVKYGSAVTLPESTFTKTGFIFAGWNTAADGSGTSSPALDADTVLYAQWTLGTGISYKVEHYRQNADDDGYTLFETENLTGTTGSQTTAAAKTYGHFTVKEFSQTTISADGTTVVKIYYDREIFTISFDANGGEGTMESLFVKFGSAVTLPENTFTKTDFIFAGWNTAADGSGTSSPALDADTVLYAQWTLGTGISYKVEHYRQNADDDGYTLFETENMTGTTGSQTTAAAKTYGHFTAKEFSQTTISSDGTTVVKIYYDREIITFTFNLAGGSGAESISGKYGQTVSVGEPTLEGADFAGWTPDLPSTYETNSTFTATWNAKWFDNSCTYDQLGLLYNSISEGGTYNIKITDTIDTETKWTEICTALSETRSVDGEPVNINLELTVDCTGLKTSGMSSNVKITDVTVHGTDKMSVVFPDCYMTIQSAVITGNSICKNTFEYCSGLTSVTIPEGVTSIGENAFYGCSGLTSVTIPESVTSIGDLAFYGCSGLTSVTIPESVTSIGYGAFASCSSLTSVTISEGVTSIGYSAFERCSGLTSVTIPEGVTSIEAYTFYGCSGLTSVTIPESVTSIGYWAFRDCSGLTSVTIPDGVTSIEAYTFTDCSGLKSVTIPSSVTSIGYSAFEYCSGLTSVTIPEGVTSIGENAFYGCSGLTSVTIPSSVTSIGVYAFSGCRSLKNVYISDLEAWMNIAFGYYESNPMSCAENLYLNGNLLTELVVPDGVTSIGNCAFAGCSGLTSVTISEDVTSIGDWAFYGCSGLASVTIPSTVTSIGEKAFAYCSGLTSVTIPESVTSIGKYAFYNCSGLTSVTFEDSTSTWAVNGNTVSVSNASQNATYLTSTYRLYTWEKNTQ